MPKPTAFDLIGDVPPEIRGEVERIVAEMFAIEARLERLEDREAPDPRRILVARLGTAAEIAAARPVPIALNGSPATLLVLGPEAPR